MHDVTPARFPRTFSRRFVLWYSVLYRLLARRARHLATVSEFSRGELAEVLGVDPARFALAPNGHEHAFEARADAAELTLGTELAATHRRRLRALRRHPHAEQEPRPGDPCPRRCRHPGRRGRRSRSPPGVHGGVAARRPRHPPRRAAQRRRARAAAAQRPRPGLPVAVRGIRPPGRRGAGARLPGGRLRRDVDPRGRRRGRAVLRSAATPRTRWPGCASCSRPSAAA